jgi:hypothetical protein
MYNVTTKISLSSTRRTNVIGGGKFCKICKDVGKTLEEYTSHYVRETPSINSKVLCPTLLMSLCRYCKQYGHTVKHCPKIELKKQSVSKTYDSHIVSNNYSIPTIESKNQTHDKFNGDSLYCVLDFDSEEEQENKNKNKNKNENENENENENKKTEKYESKEKQKLEVILTPPIKSVASYANVFDKSRIKSISPSIAESLIPVKLYFDETTDVVTLFDITNRWADGEDIEDAIVLNMIKKHPCIFTTNNNHPLRSFVSFVDALASDYTKGFTKSVVITYDAFNQLSKNWETEFFETHEGKNVLDESPAYNSKSRSIIMSERYIL